MAFSERSIFRESAIKKYLQRQEQGVLLQVVSPPAFALLWIVLLLLLAAGVLAWAVEVPISATGQGVIVEQTADGAATDGGATGQNGQEVVAALFFSPDQQGSLHQGQSVAMNVGLASSSLTGSIARVETDVISPNEARQRFNLQGTLAQVVTGPSVLVLVNIGSVSSAHSYVGSLCAAQVRIGSQRVLSLLPGFKQLLTT
jgi:hypothetical protein